MVARAPALLLACLALAQTACIELSGLAGIRQPLEETVVFGSSGPKVLLLDIQGVITDYEQPGLIGPGREGSVARVREHIGPVAVFRKAAVVERLPKTRSGKILRGTMRKMADAVPYKVPPTIDDPDVLDDIATALRGLGYPLEAPSDD